MKKRLMVMLLVAVALCLAAQQSFAVKNIGEPTDLGVLGVWCMGSNAYCD